MGKGPYRLILQSVRQLRSWSLRSLPIGELVSCVVQNSGAKYAVNKWSEGMPPIIKGKFHIMNYSHCTLSVYMFYISLHGRRSADKRFLWLRNDEQGQLQVDHGTSEDERRGTDNSARHGWCFPHSVSKTTEGAGDTMLTTIIIHLVSP